MTLDQIDEMLGRLQRASSEELLRLDLQLRLNPMRERLRLELETEGEARRLEDPDPVAGEVIPFIAPCGVGSLVAASAGKTGTFGTLTHLVVSRAVLYDTWANPNGFDSVKYLPPDSKLKGFFLHLPVILDDAFPDGAYLRFENAQFESSWVEVSVCR